MKQTGRKLLSLLLALTFVLSLFPAMTLTALATNYSNETWYVTKNDDGAITKIEYQFNTSDTARGTWYMYLWEIGDTSGENNRPKILASATLSSGNGDHTMEITYTGEPGKAYNIGTVLKDSYWSTETSEKDQSLAGWPYITNACDWKDCSTANNVYVNSSKIDGALKDALSPVPGKTNPTVTAPTANTLTYTGEAQNLVTAGSTNGGEMQYSLNGETYSTTIPTGTNAGDYTVYYKVVGNENYYGVSAKTVTVSIAKADSSVTTAPTANTLTYTGEAQDLVTGGAATGGTMMYAVTTDNTQPVDKDFSTSIPTGTDAGTYYVWYKVGGDDNHNDVSAQSVTVSIAKADSSVTTAPTANTLTYTGEAQDLVTAGAASGGTLQYAIGTDETTAPTDGWSTALPTGTGAETYYVWYKVVGDENHNDTEPVCVPVTIANRSSGGGGSVATYPVNVSEVPGGTVKPDKTQAAKDAKVTLTVTPDEGNEIDKVTVTDKDGKEIPVTRNADGTYSFQMPDSPVNVSVSFKEAAKQPASPEETGVADWLVTDDHIAYISGYADGSINPEGNITRAEVAMIFYRLLKDQDVEITASFPDVKDGDWFAQAVTTLASLKIITGYEDGTFAPGKQISRAEFTAIATRFAKAVNGTVNFSDVSADHWAASNIATGSEYGWINGYEDNSFRPSKPITRAEVAAIVNRMLARAADEAYVGANRDQLVQFSDLQDTAKWYYLDMVEATNQHDFTKTDGVEKWK